MEASNNILNELTAISSTLAAVNKVNPFTVPNGYFDTLSEEIQAKIFVEQTAAHFDNLSPVLAGINKVNPFTVPNGYFDTLSDEILAQVYREQNSSVPEGYFNGLAGNILNKIKAAETADAGVELRALSPLLYSIQTDDKLFEVPKNYFKNLPDDVLQRISKETSAEEIAHLSPLLAGIQQKNVFTVPQGYFDEFSDKIENELKPQAKVVSFSRRSTFIKYAVAAAFTGVMALTVFKFSGTGAAKAEMPQYATKGLDFLKQKNANVDAEMATLSNDDIVNYLQDNGESIDTKTLATSVLDEKNLPSEDDYLLDDKALDNFLNNVSPEDLKN